MARDEAKEGVLLANPSVETGETHILMDLPTRLANWPSKPLMMPSLNWTPSMRTATKTVH